MTIEILTGSNFKTWKRDVKLAMELVNVNLAMVTPKSTDLTDASSDTEKQVSILEHLLSGLLETTIAKEFLTIVSQRYKVSINAEIGTLLKQLYSMKYNDVGGVREYILIMVHIENKLKNLDVILLDACIVHQALNTLPLEFGTNITTYNSKEEPWNVNNFIAICAVKEDKLKAKHSSTILLVSIPHQKKKGKKFKASAPSIV
ncbi:uncharacterized protein LOC110661305 [Hevea brasiliensis]|uniref:uncharacterized protein LOC110661305 n=1 Tax=Hevea brasiliensis TaxID=3981 RepID=UPI0025FA5A31|nr:uncharacterized protein LOC110661305 [Hevea brasiliensis]